MRRAALAILLLCAAGARTGAQQPPPQQNTTEKLKSQKDELDRIRGERAELQRKMRELQSTVHDLSAERSNLERQADATARVLRTLDQQLSSLADEEHDATGELVRAQDELAVKRSVLRHRVREIYKRGALYSVEAMMSAQSFGELVARYKYLHLVAQRDRSLVQRVEVLGAQIGRQRQTLVTLRNDVESSRQEKADEEKRLRTLEEQRGRRLAQAQRSQQQTEARLAQITRDEQRIANLIATLETERKKSEGRSGNAFTSTSTLRTADLGKFDWPVDGTILYRFGKFVNPNNTTVRWNGIGIAAPAGTPVKAISAGTVIAAEAFGTYGLTVIVNNGGGDYSMYGSLGKISVNKGDKVTKGQTIGTVGKSDPELDAHLHLEIRPNGRAVDPLEWLRSRR